MGACQTKTNYNPTPQKRELTYEEKRQNEEINRIIRNEGIPALQQLMASLGPMMEKAKENQKAKGASQEDLDRLDKIQNKALPHIVKQLELAKKTIDSKPQQYDNEIKELEKETEQLKKELQ